MLCPSAIEFGALFGSKLQFSVTLLIGQAFPKRNRKLGAFVGW
jgi:hypothetical protein